MRGRSFTTVLGANLQRWLAAFGQCPTPERDLGICVWRHLHKRDMGPLPVRPGTSPIIDDPHLSILTSL